MNVIDIIEKKYKEKYLTQYKEQNKKDYPVINVGDTVRVHYAFSEMIEDKKKREMVAKERIQVFQGIVIAFKNSGINRTMTVRKVSFDVGIERIFPIYSPKIKKIEVIKRGKVRRAKLYYLRKIKGKTKIKEKRLVSNKA